MGKKRDARGAWEVVAEASATEVDSLLGEQNRSTPAEDQSKKRAGMVNLHCGDTAANPSTEAKGMNALTETYNGQDAGNPVCNQ